LIRGCPIGVAIKDGSRARILHNRFKDNGVAISAYRKKPQFNDNSFGVVIASIFENNLENFKTTQGSEIKILYPLKP
jgi:predicted hydrolase (HD superfamily)